ncbi:MAG: DUF3307 domain-containing protein [Cytophagaceae bacterium]|jgi:hypothetical protein|nr:DUF3307 domain-containing protein [Cytophagaceae bacterium]
MNYIFILGLFACHFLGDFVLSSKRMLEAKKYGRPVLPIAGHAGIHALLMYVWMYNFVLFETLLYLTMIQFVSHLIIDVAKGRLQQALPSCREATQKGYWILFGADQLLHASVILYMANYQWNR